MNKSLRFKQAALVLISTILALSCNKSDSPLTNPTESLEIITSATLLTNSNNTPNGYWKETLSRQDFVDKYGIESDTFFNSLPEQVDHYIVLAGGELYELLTFNTGVPFPIAKFPIEIPAFGTIEIFHPDSSGRKVSDFVFDENYRIAHDEDNSFQFIEGTFSIGDNIQAGVPAQTLMMAPCPGLSLCIEACEATHEALGISFLDGICCFWWPDCGEIPTVLN